MKKIKEELGKIGLNDKIESSLREEYIKSLKDEAFKELVSNLPLDEEQLMKYTTKLQTSAKEYHHCKNCSGLVECKNEINGFVFVPEIENGRINFSYVSCKYKKDQLKKEKYKENIYYFDMPKEIKEAKMGNIYTSDKDRFEVISFIKEFITKYKDGEFDKGLYLSGNFGSGKTYLIAAMFNELAKHDAKVAIIYWPEFLRDLKASFDDDFADKYNYIKNVTLLLIDDIGAENSTPWARDEILGPILQYRMQEHLTTFFTSNLNLEELEQHFSNSSYKIEQVKAKRIIERIKQLCIEMRMVSKNNRK